MKNAMIATAFAAFLAGCSSYSEIARWKSSVKTNDGEIPIGTFLTQNFSYQLFGFIPLCTGVPWTSGDCDRMDEFNVRLFKDKATLDGNLTSLKYALRRVGSDRIANLESSEEDSSMWSLLLINRHEVHTKCIILTQVEAMTMSVVASSSGK